MTPREQKIAFANHQKRIENSGSGTRRVLIQHGHQETFADGRRAQRELSADSPGDGWVSGQSGQDPNDWRSDVTGAINYLQQAIAKLNENQPGLQAALNSLLATCDVLVKAGNDVIEKAGINQGATSGPVVTRSNEASKTGGKAVIDISQWSDSQTWMRLARKHPAVFAAANE